MTRVARRNGSVVSSVANDSYIGMRQHAGCDAVKKSGDFACYIELHIEQGGLLEKAGLQRCSPQATKRNESVMQEATR